MKNKYFTDGTTKITIEPNDKNKKGAEIKLTLTQDGKDVFVRVLKSKALNIIEFTKQSKYQIDKKVKKYEKDKS